MIVRFVGSASEIIGTVRFTRFGQRADLDDAVAEALMTHPRGCAILPESVFDGIGFTQDELRRFAAPGSHAEAPQEFLEKKEQALDAYREGLNDGLR